jgi:hypothetical protein
VVQLLVSQFRVTMLFGSVRNQEKRKPGIDLNNDVNRSPQRCNNTFMLLQRYDKTQCSFQDVKSPHSGRCNK